MIDIYMSGMCENCKYADLELESTYFYSFEGERKEYELKCSHEEVCRLWEMKLHSERIKYETRSDDI